MISAAEIVESASVKAGSRHKWSNTTRRVNTNHLFNNETGRPRAPRTDIESSSEGLISNRQQNSNNVAAVSEEAADVSSKAVGDAAKEAESAEAKDFLGMSGGSGMAMHGGAGVVSSAITSGVSVKTAKINQQTAEEVSSNALQGVEDTNATNKNIAIMQNNSNLQNQVVRGNAQSLDPNKHDKLKAE